MVIAFESVYDTPVSGLDGCGLADRFRVLEREKRRLDAELAELIGECERRGTFRDDGHVTVSTWCRSIGRWSRSEASTFRRVARLCAASVEVAEALATGVLGFAQCAELARAFANPRCGSLLIESIPIFLRHAERLSFDEFRIIVRRWEQLADHDGAHKDHEASHRNRKASFDTSDTATFLHAHGGNTDGAEMRAIFDRYRDAEFRADCAAAGLDPTDGPKDLPRTAAQRAWDALHQIFLDAASTAPGAQRPEPVLDVVIDLATFEQLLHEITPDTNDETGAETGDDETVAGVGRWQPVQRPPDPRLWRCETPDGVPLPRSAALEAALLGHVRRVVIDAAGVAVDVGRRRRLFTGVLREMVLRLAHWCTWSGCTVPARHCHADHTLDHQHGGHTATHNGGPRCPRHNRLKNRGYTVWLDPDGYWHTHRPDGTEID